MTSFYVIDVGVSLIFGPFKTDDEAQSIAMPEARKSEIKVVRLIKRRTKSAGN